MRNKFNERKILMSEIQFSLNLIGFQILLITMMLMMIFVLVGLGLGEKWTFRTENGDPGFLLCIS